MTPRARTLCTLLPPLFAQRLAEAAERGDRQVVDDITDELAKAYPKLVRPRSEVAAGFASVADEKRGQVA